MEDDRQEVTDTGSGRVATTGDIEVSTYLEIAEEKGGAKSAAASETPGTGERAGGDAGGRETIVVIDFGSQYVSARYMLSWWTTILPGRK